MQPILITGSKDYHKTVEVWDILKKFFNKKSIDYFEIKSNDSNVLSKIVNLIYILDYSSIYHAILNKIDPSPVESIDYFKESLQK